MQLEGNFFGKYLTNSKEEQRSRRRTKALIPTIILPEKTQLQFVIPFGLQRLTEMIPTVNGAYAIIKYRPFTKIPLYLRKTLDLHTYYTSSFKHCFSKIYP